MRSIRGRITAWVTGVLAALVVLQGALVLGALERGLWRMADADLRDELERMAADVGDSSLAAWLASDPAPGQDWGDLVFGLRDALEREAGSGEEALLYEIRREPGALVAASPLLGAAGFGSGGPVGSGGGLRFRDAPDPRSESGRLRVVELSLGPYRLCLARSLTPLLRIEAALRQELAVILAGLCAVGVLGAFLIASSALTPLRRLAREAERLRALAEGSLPRTGRGDEVDELARILNELLGRVRADVLRTRQFSADAAHEIRTPLAAIRGHLELLLGRVDASARASLENVLEEVDRLTRLVNRLLLLEKIEGGARADALCERPLDLGRLAADLVEHLRVVAEERSIELRCEAELARVKGDPEKLRQVFLNLLDNAFEHAGSGGRVWVRVARAGSRVRAVVEDSGPGIPEDRLERVFERFASDRSRAAAGIGLGLPIARAIARAHGGELRAASPGGAAFTLELPGLGVPARAEPGPPRSARA